MVYINRDIGKIDGIIDGIILEDVIAQVNADKESQSVHVWIRTNGGDLQEAKDIYNYLKSLKKEIVTYADGNVDSAGVIILLAGNKRIGYKGLSTSMIHSTMPILGAGVYKSDELIEVGEDSKSLTDEMVKFYADITGQTKEAFAPLVRDETELNADQMKSLGFLTEIQEKPIRAVAFKKKNNAMSKEIEELKKSTEKQMNSFGASMEKILKKLGITKAANIVLQDAAGTEIDFFEKTEGDPAVGDKANIDGSPANGEYTMPDGSTLVFAAGVVTEIKEAEGDDDMAALKKENEELKKEVEGLKTANKKSEETVQEAVKEMKKMNVEFTNLKKTISSNFKVDEKEEKKIDKDDDDTPKSRSLFKKAD